MSSPPSGELLDHHPERVRRKLTAAEPGTPFVTYYAPATGARVELSRATFDNWVAKAAGMLSEEADVEADSRVLLDLRPHWLLPVWCWATWTLGAVVTLPVAEPPSNPPGLVITDNPTPPAAGIALASSRHPLGLPLGPHTPPGMVDALADIRGYPDSRHDPVPPSDTALVEDASWTLHSGAELAAAVASVPAHSRAVLMRSSPLDAQALVRAMVSPLATGGALVIVDGRTDADLAAIRSQERIDFDLD